MPTEPETALEPALTVENLTFSSVPDFLAPEECDEVVALIRADLEGLSPADYDVSRRARSVHGIEGLSLEEVKAVFEPAGRHEYERLPAAAVELLATAVDRNLDQVRITYPSVSRFETWVYVSYGAGQFITPHIDYPRNSNDPSTPKVCGISLQLNDGFEGGEFYVETASSDDLYDLQSGRERIVREGAELSSPWFQGLHRTRWTSVPARGQALLYGTGLTHGTNPVRSGRSEKLIGFFL